MKQNQFEFKPFDQVLVRDHDTHPWRVSLFSHYMPKQIDKAYVCIAGTFYQCIPYNENTAHLIGTNKPYEKPEPKVWHVQGGNIKGIELFEELYSDNEFKKFLENNSLQKKYKWIHIVHIE